MGVSFPGLWGSADLGIIEHVCSFASSLVVVGLLIRGRGKKAIDVASRRRRFPFHLGRGIESASFFPFCFFSLGWASLEMMV
jgi:hypothetical protein